MKDNSWGYGVIDVEKFIGGGEEPPVEEPVEEEPPVEEPVEEEPVKKNLWKKNHLLKNLWKKNCGRRTTC